VVVEGAEQPAAVLLRALEPVDVLEFMRANRSGRIAAARLRDTDLCSGPAKLAQALGLDRTLDGADLVFGEALYIEPGMSIPRARIVAAPRIGVGYAAEWADKPLRFYVAGNPHIS
jgi:DNA-3-methyladenine glycosylase